MRGPRPGWLAKVWPQPRQRCLDVIDPQDQQLTRTKAADRQLEGFQFIASLDRFGDPAAGCQAAAELFKGALLAGVKYAEGRKAVEFEATDSASQKLLYIYRLLVHDKIIQPLPEDQVAEASMRHKLAIWYSKQLPKDHPLLN